MEPGLWFTLLKLAELGNENSISTTTLGEILKISQQSGSRHIRRLEKLGLITRITSSLGQKITITKEGLDKLREIYWSLNIIFKQNIPSFYIKGAIFTGLGEGAYYVSRPDYLKQFEKKLGFTPFPGTLNLKLISDQDIKTRKLIESIPGIIISSFENKERSFGDVKCYPVFINNKIKGALIFIQRTHYPENVIEIISDKNLRQFLKLKDNDIIKLEIKIN